MTTQYYLTKKGCSERYASQDHKPVIYDDEETAWDYADAMTQRMPYDWEPIGVEEWRERYIIKETPVDE